MIILLKVMNFFLAVEGFYEGWRSLKMKKLLFLTNKVQLERTDWNQIYIYYIYNNNNSSDTEIDPVVLHIWYWTSHWHLNDSVKVEKQ